MSVQLSSHRRTAGHACGPCRPQMQQVAAPAVPKHSTIRWIPGAPVMTGVRQISETEGRHE